MTIRTANQLNTFIVSRGLTTPEKIISRLASDKVIVSTKMAKLLLERHNSLTD